MGSLPHMGTLMQIIAMGGSSPISVLLAVAWLAAGVSAMHTGAYSPGDYRPDIGEGSPTDYGRPTKPNCHLVPTVPATTDLISARARPPTTGGQPSPTATWCRSPPGRTGARTTKRRLAGPRTRRNAALTLSTPAHPWWRPRSTGAASTSPS